MSLDIPVFVENLFSQLFTKHNALLSGYHHCGVLQDFWTIHVATFEAMSVSSVQRERFRWLMALVGVGACLSSSVGLSQHGDTLRFLEQGGAEEEEEEVSPVCAHVSL